MDVLDSGLYIDDKRLYDYAAASARLLKPGVTRSGRRRRRIAQGRV